jgi:hypothetical protein
VISVLETYAAASSLGPLGTGDVGIARCGRGGAEGGSRFPHAAGIRTPLTSRQQGEDLRGHARERGPDRAMGDQPSSRTDRAGWPDRELPPCGRSARSRFAVSRPHRRGQAVPRSPTRVMRAGPRRRPPSRGRSRIPPGGGGVTVSTISWTSAPSPLHDDVAGPGSPTPSAGSGPRSHPARPARHAGRQGRRPPPRRR